MASGGAKSVTTEVATKPLPARPTPAVHCDASSDPTLPQGECGAKRQACLPGCVIIGLLRIVQHRCNRGRRCLFLALRLQHQRKSDRPLDCEKSRGNMLAVHHRQKIVMGRCQVVLLVAGTAVEVLRPDGTLRQVPLLGVAQEFAGRSFHARHVRCHPVHKTLGHQQPRILVAVCNVAAGQGCRRGSPAPASLPLAKNRPAPRKIQASPRTLAYSRGALSRACCAA